MTVLSFGLLTLMVFLWVVFVLDSTSGLRRPRWTTGDQDLNEMVDNILPNVSQHFVEWSLDPLYLGNLHTQDLSECRLIGLSTIYRSGNCVQKYVGPEGVSVQASLGFRRISGSCRYDKRLLLLQNRGTVHIKMQNVNAVLQIGQRMTDDAHPTLDYIDIAIPYDMELEATGRNTLTFILDALKLFYRRRMRSLVKNTVQDKFRALLIQWLRSVTLADVTQAFTDENYSKLFNSSFLSLL